MHEDSEQTYYEKRASDERRRADQAGSEIARAIHEQLAERYDQLARGTGYAPNELASPPHGAPTDLSHSR